MTEPDSNMDTSAIQLSCRACEAQNRFPQQRALDELGSLRCGRCKTPLLRVHGEPLPDLNSEALAHPWDKDALEKLKSIPYAEKLLSSVMKGTIDKMSRFHFLASAIKVSEQQAPDLLLLHHEAARRLDIDPPELFITQSPLPNAFSIGTAAPIVAVTTALVDLMGERELVAILGHELTHIKLGHALFRTLALLLTRGGVGVLDRLMGIGSLLVTPLRLGLMHWHQMSELSADRGEVVAAGSLQVAIRCHMMMAGGSSKLVDRLDIAAFIAQADEAEKTREEDLMVKAFEFLDSSQQTHPLPAWRVHHLIAWAKTPAFFELLAGAYQPALEPPE